MENLQAFVLPRRANHFQYGRAVQKFCHGFARGLDRNCWRSAELTAAPQQLRSDSKHIYQALTGGAALWPPCDAAGGVLRPPVSEQIPTAS